MKCKCEKPTPDETGHCFECDGEVESRETRAPLIAVWFSCGAASACAAKLTLDQYGATHDVRVLNTPILEEDEDNRRFLEDVQLWLNHPIETVVSSKYPNSSAVEVWEDRRFMSSPYGAPCTLELKKKPRQEWEKKHNPDFHVLGFTYDERHRHERFIMTERDNLLPVLIDSKMNKVDCYMYLLDAGLRLPRVYSEGHPNANCMGCPKSKSPTYWNHIRRTRPQVFEQRAEQSRDIGARLVMVKGERIYLDELDPLAEGLPMKNMDNECGIFCMEQ